MTSGTELPTQPFPVFYFVKVFLLGVFFYHINFMGNPPVCVSYFCSAGYPRLYDAVRFIL